jgi:hypothetical protein
LPHRRQALQGTWIMGASAISTVSAMFCSNIKIAK